MRNDAKQSVLGVLVNVVDYDGAVERVVAAAKNEESLAVTALAVHGVMTGALDRAHRTRLNAFDIVTPDGQPVRWALNVMHRAKLPKRVYGPELMMRLCQRAEAEGLPIYLYGSTPEMLATLRVALEEKCPGIQIAGARPSRFRPLTDDEAQEVADSIRASGARMVFVGLGCPRQEVFVHEMHRRVGLPMLAVGAAFAYHSGATPHPPRWMQDWGLEWLYRFVREPRRLWQRYLILNPAYVALLAAQALRLRKFRTDPPVTATTAPVWG